MSIQDRVNEQGIRTTDGRERWRWILEKKAKTGINPEHVGSDVLRLAVAELEELDLHREFIETICDTLVEVGPWEEIDGDGTEGSVISDHITELAGIMQEAVALLRKAQEFYGEIDGTITEFLADLDERPWTVPSVKVIDEMVPFTIKDFDNAVTVLGIEP